MNESKTATSETIEKFVTCGVHCNCSRTHAIASISWFLALMSYGQPGKCNFKKMVTFGDGINKTIVKYLGLVSISQTLNFPSGLDDS